MQTIGRNQPCPCGSGLKYKKCCASKEQGSNVALKQEESALSTIALREPEVIEPEVIERRTLLEKIDSKTMDTILSRVNQTLGELSEELGLSLAFQKASYSSINAKFEVQAAIVRPDGVIMNREAETFLERCGDFALLETDLGRVFRCGIEDFRIVGLSPRAKRAIICEQLGPRGPLRKVRIGAEQVRRHLQ